MNIDRKSLILIMLLAAITLCLFVGVRVAREAPRSNMGKISNVFIGKDWPTNQTDHFTILERDLTCQPDDGTQWACEVMLEGKRLEMTASTVYGDHRYHSVAGCTVVYGGTPIACDVMLGGWGTILRINTDLGISPARMAELRAQRPLSHLNEDGWMGLGIAWASVLAFLVVLVLLTVFNKIPCAELLGMRLPVWMICLMVIALAALINRLTGVLFFFFPLGAGGIGVLLMLILRLNRRDRKHGPSLAHAVMWSSVSLVAFWVTNIVTIIGLMVLGYID